MQLRNLADSTQRYYVHYVAGFATYFDRSPEILDREAVGQYQLYLLNERKLSAQSVNQYFSAVKFLYLTAPEMPWTDEYFPRVRVPRRLPVVLSQEELMQFFDRIPSLKYRAALMTCYGAGLRISEAVALKIDDIDSQRMLIRVEQGKGKSQNLHLHAHLHVVVPGGGLSPDGEWIACRPGFFLPVRVLSRLFLDALEKAHAVGGPRQVLEYLGRYTHRVAISNSRLLALTEGRVSFRWKDYRHPQRPKVMTVSAEEFIRRFLLHALPRNFQRIRYYGLLANCHRSGKLDVCRDRLQTPISALLPRITDSGVALVTLTASNSRLCPKCPKGTRMRKEIRFPCHGPIPGRMDSS